MEPTSVKPDLYREKIAVRVAALAVIAFVLSGPAAMIATMWRGQPIGFPGDWNAAMLSLASTAFGALWAGKIMAGANSAIGPAVSVPVADPGSTKVEVSSTTPASKPAGA